MTISTAREGDRITVYLHHLKSTLSEAESRLLVCLLTHAVNATPPPVTALYDNGVSTNKLKKSLIYPSYRV